MSRCGLAKCLRAGESRGCLFFLSNNIRSIGVRKMLINGHSNAYVLKVWSEGNNEFSCQVTWESFFMSFLRSSQKWINVFITFTNDLESQSR